MGFRGRLVAAEGVTSGEFAGDYQLSGQITVGDPAARHIELGILADGHAAQRFYDADGVTVLIDLDANFGSAAFGGNVSVRSIFVEDLDSFGVSGQIQAGRKKWAGVIYPIGSKGDTVLELTGPGGYSAIGAGRFYDTGDGWEFQAAPGTGGAPPFVAIRSTRDVDLTDDSGVLVLGAAGAGQLGLDANEIQARNGGVASILFINGSGGTVQIGGAIEAELELGGGTASGVGRLHDRAGDPATAAGGGRWYSKAGALYWKGGLGTVTKIANA